MKRLVLVIVVIFCCSITKAQLEESNECFNQAFIELAKGNKQKAFQLMKKSVDILPQYYPVISLADMYMLGEGTQQDIKKAKYYYRLVADSNLDDTATDEVRIIVSYACRTYVSACLMENENDFSLLVCYLEKAHDVSGDAYSEYLLGLAYYTAKEDGIVGLDEDKEKGIELLKISAEKDCLCAISKLATIFSDLGDEDLAVYYNMKGTKITPFDMAKATDPFSPLTTPNPNNNPLVIEAWNRCLYNTGYYFASEGHADEAIPYLEKLTIEKPRYNSYRGMCYAMVGNADAAKADFEKALKLDPNDGVTYNVMGLVYAGIWEDKQTGAAYFKKAIELGCEIAKQNYKDYILGE